ncbi:hypothetical protein BJV82DRAFT_707661 [Fennellomyces sp. T-0311]|nr:hypothetical protein BJV82DRAFT_707661 [Fennellomyces sp. T-0311]
MDKDVTTQNIRSNLGFWDDNADTALSMSPVIMLTLSCLIYTGSRYDFFTNTDTWDEATLQAYNNFINSFLSSDSVEGLNQLVTVTRCDPGAADFCLCIAKEHPGNLNYDPAVQQLKCNEIYWTLCCFFALQEAVSNALPTFPAEDAVIKEWLIDIKQVYDRTAEQSGLVGILRDIKQQVADTDAANFSTRMTAARSRTGAPTEPSEPRRGAPLVFEDHPHIPKRVAQFEQMKAEETIRVCRGISHQHYATPTQSARYQHSVIPAVVFESRGGH